MKKIRKLKNTDKTTSTPNYIREGLKSRSFLHHKSKYASENILFSLFIENLEQLKEKIGYSGEENIEYYN